MGSWFCPFWLWDLSHITEARFFFHESGISRYACSKLLHGSALLHCTLGTS